MFRPTPRRPWRPTLFLIFLTVGSPAAAQPSSTQVGRDWKRHVIDDSIRGADGVRLADFDGDGRLDIVTGWEEAGTVRLYLRPGPEAVTEPWPAVTVAEAGSPEDAVPFDVDGDGRLDVVSCHEGKTRQLLVAWNRAEDPCDRHQLLNRTSWKTDRWEQLDGTLWMYAVPIEVGGQSALAAAAKGGGASITLLTPGSTERSDLSRWNARGLRQVGWIMSLRARDMDGDGDSDLLYSDRKGTDRCVGWLEQPSDSSAAWVDHRLGGEDNEVMFLDATEDRIVVATRNGSWLDLRRQRASEWNVTAHPNPPGVKHGKAIARLDDRRLVMTANTLDGGPDRSQPGLWLRSAEGRWQVIDETPAVKFDRIETLDLDGDGDPDVLTCEERHRLGVVWYENPG